MVTIEQLPVTIDSLCEGPHWDEEEQVLYFVEIVPAKVHKYNPATKKDIVIKLDAEALSVVLPLKDKKNQFLISTGRDISIMTWDGVSDKPSHIERIATVHEDDGKLENHLNDGKADVKGRLWIGSRGPMKSLEDFVPDQGCLFSLSQDRKVVTQETGITLSNGIGWSPDNRTMYHVDSLTHKVYAFDFDTELGRTSNRRTIFDVKGSGLEGFPDGMTVDTDGNLWIAIFMGGKVVQVDPKTSSVLKTVDLPCSMVTSATFGGKALDELYVTTAWFQFKEGDPKPKPSTVGVFCIKGTGARGFPGQRVTL